LSLDVINITNENDRLRQEFTSKNRSGFNEQSRMIVDMQNDNLDEMKRKNKKLEENVTYLKSEIERYKKELIEREVNFQKEGKRSGLSDYGKDFDRIEV
jgi:predicted translin family RNA/ssDNA-binding protein